MSKENIRGGGFYYNFDWDDAVEDDCIYPSGDCETCPFRKTCQTRRLLEEADAE